MRRLFSLGSIVAAYTKIESSPKVDAEVTASPADPEVVEFFKYFPEPYKQHVIERYSTRDGLYRWKIFRQMDMEKEKQSALSGDFLEDIRRTEELAAEQEIADRKEKYEDRKRHFHDREIPQWEQWVLNYIPLQPWDKMKSKLFQVSLASLSGVSFVLLGFACLKEPKFSRLKAYYLLVASTAQGISLQIFAVARLMDLGPFDRSVDDRDLVEKFKDGFQENYRWIGDFVNEGSTRK